MIYLPVHRVPCAVRRLYMQFHHISILEGVVPLHHLPVINGFAPDSGVLQLLLEVFVNFFSQLFELAVSRQNKRSRRVMGFSRCTGKNPDDFKNIVDLLRKG